jgi:hypothetical protein
MLDITSLGFTSSCIVVVLYLLLLSPSDLFLLCLAVIGSFNVIRELPLELVLSAWPTGVFFLVDVSA